MRCPPTRNPSPVARRSRRLLARARDADRLADAVLGGARLQPAAVRALVRRRPHQPVPQRGRPPPRDARASQPALIFISTETGQRRTLHLRRARRRGQPLRGDAARAGRRQGRPRTDLHADDSRGGIRDARDGAHRRDSLGGVRRLRRGEPGDAHRRREAEGHGHRRRRHARRQGHCRTSPWSTRRCGSRSIRPQRVDHRRPPARPGDEPRRRAAISTTPRSSPTHAGARVPCEWLESSEPSYILYTSGTTGKPKGVQRDTGGYAVALAASMRDIFCVAPGETMFTTSDIGWVVGHSYIVYAPLLNGSTTIMYEGLPIRPDPAIWWQIVDEHKVRTMFSSPTAIRVLKKQDHGVHEAARPLVPRVPVPRRRAARRADRALGDRRARRGHRRQLLADRKRLADPVRATRHRGHAAQVRQPVVSGRAATTCACSTK